MITYTKKERELYNAYRDRVCSRLDISIKDYNYLRLTGEKLRRLWVREGNGEGIAGDAQEEKILTDRIEKRAGKLGVYLYLQTDPRGATVYIDREPITRKAYTNACCIY